MYIIEKRKLIIVIGRNTDPALQAWLGQKGHRTQRGAAPHVNWISFVYHSPYADNMPGTYGYKK